MSTYNPPINNLAFILQDVFRLPEFLNQINFPCECDEELIQAILEEAGKFCSQVLAPINRHGDEQGCSLNDNKVTTPDGYKEAYQQFIDSGWSAFSANPKFGGQGMPKSLQVLLDEMLHSSNTSFCLYYSLTNGAVHALEHHASEAMQQLWLPRLISGTWSGTMCLTESHAGTDLGLIKTTAKPVAEDVYSINGSKIFITGGEHDLSENIVHLVLAKLPDAPPGVKGISMFIVPKFLLDEQGNLGERNAVNCGAIEHKMGIKASSTCVMNFDDAKGYLVGEAHQGIKYMFSMMNNERLSIGIQGVGLAEQSYQTAVDYAKERLQSKSPDSVSKGPDAIIAHPDVKRMLMWMRSNIQAARMSSIWIGMEIDKSNLAKDPSAKAQSDKLVAYLTPVAKAHYTNMGFEACNHGMQVLGGHGYIREWGQEQLVRDARIAQIYEGTNGIQAMDLIGRKLLFNNGDYYKIFADWLASAHQKLHTNHDIPMNLRDEMSSQFKDAITALDEVVHWLLKESKDRSALAGSVATDFLELNGICWFAGMWILALCALKNATYCDEKQAQSQRYLAQFYFDKVLIRHHLLTASILKGESSMMGLETDQF